MSEILKRLFGKDNTGKNIIVFNGREYIKCDSCGNIIDEMPCKKCGGSPIKDLDSLWNSETILSEKKFHQECNYGTYNSYFRDGGVSLRHVW